MGRKNIQTTKKLIDKYQENLSDLLAVIQHYEATGRGQMCTYESGKTSVYDIVIKDLETLINK